MKSAKTVVGVCSAAVLAFSFLSVAGPLSIGAITVFDVPVAFASGWTSGGGSSSSGSGSGWTSGGGSSSSGSSWTSGGGSSSSGSGWTSGGGSSSSGSGSGWTSGGGSSSSNTSSSGWTSGGGSYSTTCCDSNPTPTSSGTNWTSGGGSYSTTCCDYTPTTYTSTSGGGSSTSSPTPKPAPTCTLSAHPSAINKGGSSTLSWTSTNATSGTINQGVGAVNPNNTAGTRTVSPTNTTTYTLTVTGAGGTKTCQATVTVKVPTHAPTCVISVNPSQVKYGHDAIITWSSTNASSASLTSLGSVSVNGSRTIFDITASKNYTLTVKGNGKTATCHASVTVKKEDPKVLECKLKASDSRIDRGDSVKISWSSEGAEYGYISPTIGDVDENGSETVRPRETTTYKGTFYNDDGDKVTCSVKVNVDEYEPPVYYPPQTPYVTLSAVPYTGFELGPVGTTVYWSLLVLWSLFAAYLIAVKKAHHALARRLKSFLFGRDEVVVTAAPITTVVHTTAPVRAAQPAHLDLTDEFVLSQLSRGRHAH